jgi:hypothetical protein
LRREFSTIKLGITTAISSFKFINEKLRRLSEFSGSSQIGLVIEKTKEFSKTLHDQFEWLDLEAKNQATLNQVIAGCEAALERAELKSQIKNLKSLDCTAGKYNEGGRWGNSESVIRHSEITVTERDLIIKDLEAQIEHIQEELDTHNHNTEI